jgi:membrane-associated protease RseP (regulator of RpoE activity)
MHHTDRLTRVAAIKHALEGVFVVERYEFNEFDAVRLQGAWRIPPNEALPSLVTRFATLNSTPVLHNDAHGVDLFIIPGVTSDPALAPANESRETHQMHATREVRVDPRLNIVLFLATVVSVVLTGGLESDGMEGVRLNLPNGLMFAGSLLSILVAHEMGHYVVGRIRGLKTTWPIFIPLPFISIGGTLGAVIVQSSPFKNRRTLLEVGVAGPLAGFIVAVPLFLLGLWLTNPTPSPVPPGTTFLGDSLLTQILGLGILGPVYSSTLESVLVHPVAFGAWIGLLITGINLIPAGQLDGGHIAYALFGRNARFVSWASIGAMILLSFISEAWVIWAVMLFFFGRRHPPIIDESSPLTAAHFLLALAGLLVLILTFVPTPIFRV